MGWGGVRVDQGMLFLQANESLQLGQGLFGFRLTFFRQNNRWGS